MAAIEEVVAAIEEMGGDVRTSYRERRPATWLERRFDDPGSADDPVKTLAMTSMDFRWRDVRERGAIYELSRLRAHIRFYKAQHGGLLPSADLSELTTGTSLDGTDGTEFGPYLLEIPANSMTDKSDKSDVKSIFTATATTVE